MKDYYKILGIGRSATADEIKEAFRTLAQKYHPDRNKSEDAVRKFQEVNEAYQTLEDEHKRALYTYDLKRSEQSSSSAYSSYSSPTTNPTANEQEYHTPQYYQRTYTGVRTRPKRPLPRWLQVIVDLGQLFSWALLGAGLGMGLALAKRLFLGVDELWQINDMVAGTLCGAIAAITLPSENRLERALRQRFKDGYNFFRSVASCLAGVFWGGWIGEILAYQFELEFEPTIYLSMLVGGMLFGWIANEEAFWTKIRLPRAYFEMLFVLMRSLGVAILFGGMALVISWFLQIYGISSHFWLSGFYGFLLGGILGSMAPSDLLAYARYASAYVGRWIVLLCVSLAVIIGIALEAWLHLSDIIDRW